MLFEDLWNFTFLEKSIAHCDISKLLKRRLYGRKRERWKGTYYIVHIYVLYVYRRPRKSFKPRPFAVFPALLRRFSTASKGGGCGTTVLAASLASSLDRVEVAPVLLVAEGGA